MKEIVAGACLLAIAFISISAVNHARSVKPDPTDPSDITAHRLTVIVFAFLAFACGFSGCGIFIRGVFR